MAKAPAKAAKTKAKPSSSPADNPENTLKKAVPAEAWLSNIDDALKREKKWRDRGKDVVKRFRDERDRALKNRSFVNILWSNTEVLKAALYVKTAKPDVRRRFTDVSEDRDASRAAAEVIERSVAYVVDIYDIDPDILSAIEDLLLPGRGTCWVSYEPEILDEDTESPRVGEQKLCTDYVYWEDYCHGIARQAKNIPWHARRLTPTKGEFEARWPDAKKVASGPSYKITDADGGEGVGEFIEVWEIWNKPKRERLYVARNYADVLQEDADPLGLRDFFPCPRPLYSVTTTDRLTPEPEFCQYQDQAIELDETSTRIRRLTEELRFRGVYDGSIDGENVLAQLPDADDGTFLPYSNWAGLKEKGGIENAVGFWPIEKIIVVLQQLYPRAQMLIQQIYQVTGISDIMRGSTDPNETKGAQQLKAQFGSMRMQRRQKDVQRFIRDLYRIMAEIICEHFTQETLAEITGMDLPTKAEQDSLRQKVQAAQALQAASPTPPMPPQSSAGPPQGANPPDVPAAAGPALGPSPAQLPPPQAAPQGDAGFTTGQPIPAGAAPTLKPTGPTLPPEIIKVLDSPTWEDVMAILRSDKVRGYRVDIETDNTTMEDADAEKQRRIEAVTVINDLLDKAYLAAAHAPVMLPLIKELFLFGLRSFNVARSLEQSFEDAFDELSKNPPPAPQDQNAKPDTSSTDQAKIALDAKKAELDQQHRMAALQADTADKAARLELERQNQAARLSLDQQKNESDVQTKQASLALEADKHQHAKTKDASDLSLRVAAHNKQMVDQATAEAAGGDDAGASGAVVPSQSPFEAVLQRLDLAIQALVAGQQQTAEEQKAIAAGQASEIEQLANGQAALIAQLSAPKRIVRGADGRAMGVETMAVN